MMYPRNFDLRLEPLALSVVQLKPSILKFLEYGAQLLFMLRQALAEDNYVVQIDQRQT